MSGQKSSHTDTSKLKGVFCNTRSWPASEYSRHSHSSRLHTPPCSFIAPLGRPVDPEVKIT